ncbi:hypothetical protein [[Clostridium] fimetarium]|uniref:Uncharacterized protein n=1 Tax=[Clostridium] fimetarium TaxID=99656 RepID=A0A1I0RAV0_9FIRM|nr:hypothetical protein [[Clostridium] fimetarium]SEW37957.1 hypothetical protein SAMN05421659_11397 [[Clostridium] fimetarium]
MEQSNKRKIKDHKLCVFINLILILFSTNISNSIAYGFNYDATDVDCIRYQIALVITCIIISINSCIYLFIYTKTDKKS